MLVKNYLALGIQEQMEILKKPTFNIVQISENLKEIFLWFKVLCIRSNRDRIYFYFKQIGKC